MGEGSVKLEFYGGPWDGERKEIATSQREILVPEAEQGPISLARELEPMPEITTMKIYLHVYTKKAFKKGNAGPVELRMIYEGMRSR